MSQATTYQSFDLPSRLLDVSRVWRTTSDVFGAAPRHFILLGLLPLPAALAAATPILLAQGKDIGSFGLSAVLAALEVLFLGVGQNAAVYGTGRILAGDTFAMGDALAMGVGRLPALVGAWILSGIVVLVGLGLLVVPGFVALAALSLVGGACVIERCGPLAAMRRSVVLARGNLWRAAGAFLVVIGVPLTAIVAVGGTLVGVFYAMHTEFSLVVTAGLSAIIVAVIVTLFPAIAMVLIAVLFVELRRIKEGIQPEPTEIF